ncbi:SET domain-containing protein [Hypoxylon sp. FL1284]|nr:SET domain-containing protein [Hypoxylon sp. FL1284]
MWHYALLLALQLGRRALGAQPSEVPSWLREYDFDPPRQCRSDGAGPLHPRAIEEAVCPIPIDDVVAFERRSWLPWTFPPVCAEPEDKGGPKLCVYSYQKLRGNAGISIVTTPETAAAGVGVLEDADPRWADWARGRPLVVADDPPPYEFVELEGRGVGVIARRAIPKGEVVMLRYPVVVRLSDSKHWKNQDLLKLLHRAAVQLPPRDAGQMMKLARSKGGYVVDDIINTNAFGVKINGLDHSALYVDVSRLNHACKPNMFSRVSSTSLGMEVVAYRDVEAGEELTFSYTPLNLLSEQRQPLIQEWGFNCSCLICASPDESASSDRRRGRIQDLLAELDRPETRNHAAVQARVNEIVDLCKTEAMAAQIGDFYTIVADVYSSMGDIDMARKYGELALKELTHFAGYDHERTHGAAQFLKGLEERVRT